MGAKKDPKTGLTPKQELFAQCFVECNNATQSYKDSYDIKPTTKESSTTQAAHNVLRLPPVAARIMALQHELLVDFKMEMGWFLNQLLINYYQAVEEQKPGHAHKVLETLGKYLGLDKLPTDALAKVFLYAPDNGRINKEEKP